MNDRNMNNIGDNFQQETKYNKDKMSGKPLDWASKPELYKNYMSVVG